MKKQSLIGIFIFTLLWACQDRKPENGDIRKLEIKPACVIVMGIDETGSYKLWDQVKNTVVRIIQQLEPGSILYFRRITDVSYLDECTIFRLELPIIKGGDNNNPFDRKSKNIRGKQINKINLLKRQACQRLAAVKFTNAKYTDIYGFLAAAKDRFDLVPNDFQRILIIASDLKDNVRHKVKLDLSNVNIAVIGFQVSKDPGETQKHKEKWIKKLTNAGASKVTFMPIEEKLSLNKF